MRQYLLYGLAGVLVMLGLQALLPYQPADTRSTEVLGLLNSELKWRPRGVALADLTSFAWDEACTLAPHLTAEDLTAETGIALPDNFEPEGEGWLLVFAKNKALQAATRVPPSFGVLEQKEPLRCIADPRAFLTVLERDGAQGPPRRFVLRS